MLQLHCRSNIIISRLLGSLCLALTPLTASCQVTTEKPSAPDTSEFRLYINTVSDVFGNGPLRDMARAAAAGNAEGVVRAAKAGADANGRGIRDLTPLLWSIMANNAVGVKALLEVGADPNLPRQLDNGKSYKWDEYPVNIAAKGKPEILKALLDGGAMSRVLLNAAG